MYLRALQLDKGHPPVAAKVQYAGASCGAAQRSTAAKARDRGLDNDLLERADVVDAVQCDIESKLSGGTELDALESPANGMQVGGERTADRRPEL